MSKGLVYILINPAFPEYIKIGRTSRSSEDRIEELSKSTAAPCKFKLVYEEYYDNCEQLESYVHRILDKYRLSRNKEFFSISIKQAIETIQEVIKKINNQEKINFDSNDIFDKYIWWNNINDTWKKVFKSNITINYEPSELDLIDSFFSLILDTKNNDIRKNDIRKKVIDFIKDVRFKDNIKKWYSNLNNDDKNSLKVYIKYNLSEIEIDSVLNMRKLDLSNYPEIDDLTPILELNNLEELNCNGTSIRNLEIFKKIPTLKILDIGNTKIKSLDSLLNSENIEIIYCYHSDVNKLEIDKFKNEKPHCKIELEKAKGQLF